MSAVRESTFIIPALQVNLLGLSELNNFSTVSKWQSLDSKPESA
jgi:hypothetical protein